jgi:hypothetical protein
MADYERARISMREGSDRGGPMKTKIFLRIGKQGGKIKVDARVIGPSIEPLREGSGRYAKAIPTIYMALDLEIPDEAFRPPNISASISVPIEKLGTAVEVIDPLRITGGVPKNAP